MEAIMKRIGRFSCFLILIGAIFATYCWGDWKAELTKLGFYAVINGKAIPLNFKALGDGETERSLSTNDFPNLSILKKGDFIALYGEMPPGPLGTTVEVFRYSLNSIKTRYMYIKNAGEANDFFDIIPQPPLNGQKLVLLTPKEDALPSPYFLHKYQGADADAYAGFQIGGEGGDVSTSTPSQEKTTATNPYALFLDNLPKELLIEATPENLRISLEKALENISERTYVNPPSNDRTNYFRGKTQKCLEDACSFINTARLIAKKTSDSGTIDIMEQYLVKTWRVKELFNRNEMMRSYNEQRSLLKEMKSFLEKS
jgi:uncharacterized protein YqkB